MSEYKILSYPVSTLVEAQQILADAEQAVVALIHRIDHAAPDILEHADRASEALGEARNAIIHEIGWKVVNEPHQFWKTERPLITIEPILKPGRPMGTSAEAQEADVAIALEQASGRHTLLHGTKAEVLVLGPADLDDV